jgi:transcriptional regulator with XRE-family HTH domain
MTRKGFGDLVRRARQSRNLSQAALARAARTSAAFICQIERGDRIPSDRIARRLAIALGLQWQEVVRIVYRLRSPEAKGLFDAPTGLSSNSLYELPAVRNLLLHLATLNLTERDLESLIRNWNNDLTLLVDLAKARRQ